MAIWGDGGNGGWFVGFGGLGLIVLAILFFTHQGPFQQCVKNGLGVEYCGDEAKSYCRTVSDRIAGRTDACNEILGEDEPVGSGQDPAMNGLGGSGTGPYGDPSADPYDPSAGYDPGSAPVYTGPDPSSPSYTDPTDPSSPYYVP